MSTLNLPDKKIQIIDYMIPNVIDTHDIRFKMYWKTITSNFFLELLILFEGVKLKLSHSF